MSTPPLHVAHLLSGVITKATKRNQQRRVGPSDIGNPCDRCLGLALAKRIPDGPRPRSVRGFSLMAWIGTAVHKHLELLIAEELKKKGAWRKHRENVQQESTVRIGRLPGYGKIKGHTDLYFDPVVVDFKTSSMAKIKGWRVLGPPIQYQWQAHLYGYGLRNMGHSVTHVMLYFIPRDSNNLNDIWTWSSEYDEEIALQALKRAKRIWKEVRRGNIELLESDSSCYDCSPMRQVSFHEEGG